MNATDVSRPEADGESFDDPRPSRRGMLGRAGRAAAVALVGVASVVTTPNRAAAHQYGCCGLARPHNKLCPARCRSERHRGFTLRYWTCNSGTHRQRCYECTRAESCWEGPFLCSFYTNATRKGPRP